MVAPLANGEDFSFYLFGRRVVRQFLAAFICQRFSVDQERSGSEAIGAASTIGKLFSNRRSRIADFIDDLL